MTPEVKEIIRIFVGRMLIITVLVAVSRAQQTADAHHWTAWVQILAGITLMGAAWVGMNMLEHARSIR